LNLELDFDRFPLMLQSRKNTRLALTWRDHGLLNNTTLVRSDRSLLQAWLVACHIGDHYQDLNAMFRETVASYQRVG
jgi:hypothetical protein